MEYEGEYLNGKKTGKVIEYYDNSILKLEGEFLNDERWNGMGEEYEENNYEEEEDHE